MDVPIQVIIAINNWLLSNRFLKPELESADVYLDQNEYTAVFRVDCW